MSVDNRAMTVAQARALAGDPNVAPAVMVRLANGYPEVWSALLENPSLYPELRSWLEAAMAPPQPVRSATPSASASSAESLTVDKTPGVSIVRRASARWRRRRSNPAKIAMIVGPPAVIILAMFIGVSALFAAHPESGVISTQEIRQQPAPIAAWKYSLETQGLAKCAQYSMKDFEQDQVLVLVQNNLSDKECREQEKPAPSTLALVNSKTGAQLWKIDLASEISWTRSWRKEIVSVPGLNEIILKLTDVNGADAAGDKKSVDDDDDRKMKTLIPINKLNGRITDPVIAKSEAQPTMQAPVVEVLALPGDTQNLLIMSNGSDRDFRYAHHRAKNLSSANWSYESDLAPIGGNPLVANQLILGRDDEDEPVALDITRGTATAWAGPSGGKMYTLHNFHVHVIGDGVTDKVSNVASQGGKNGHDVTLTGIDPDGAQRWAVDAKGFALSHFVPTSRMADRDSFTEIYAVSGDSNRTLTRLDPQTGSKLWSKTVSSDQFELSKLSNSSTGVLYLTAEGDSQAKTFAPFNIDSGDLSEDVAIPGAQARVDGATGSTLFVVNEPERKRIIADIESGKQSSSDEDGTDKSDETRTCVVGINVSDSSVLWEFSCNGNEHIVLLGGNWMILDKTPGSENLRPLAMASRTP